MKHVPCRLSLDLLIILILTPAVEAQGQTRYSLNTVGYADAQFYAGSNLIANPFNAGNNSISNLLRDLPAGSIYLPWTRERSEFGPPNTLTSESGWTTPDATLLRRDAGFLWVPEARTVSFVGEPWPGMCFQFTPGFTASGVIPKYACGFCADFTECQINPEMQIAQWDRATQQFKTSEYMLDIGWYPTQPTLTADEAAVIFIPAASGVLARSFGPSTTIGEVPLLNPRLDGTNFHFEFPSANGVTYVVQRSDNIAAGRWETVLTATTTTAGAFIPVDVPAGGKAAFYRLHAVRLLNPSRTGTSFQFQFYAELGTQYQVSRSPALEQPAWQTFATVEGQGRTTTFTDPAAEAPVAYYRLAY